MRGKLAKMVRRMASKMTVDENMRTNKYVVNERTGVIRLFPKCERALYQSLKKNVLFRKRNHGAQ